MTVISSSSASLNAYTASHAPAGTLTRDEWMKQTGQGAGSGTVTREQLIREGFVADPRENLIGTDEARAQYEAEALAAARMKSDDAPENVWGRIVIGGEVVAEIYRNGAFSYSGGGDLDIDNSRSLKEIAHQLMQQIGGYLQPGPAAASERQDLSAAFGDATRQLQNRLAVFFQSGSARGLPDIG